VSTLLEQAVVVEFLKQRVAVLAARVNQTA
jgi:hypothetical protein